MGRSGLPELLLTLCEIKILMFYVIYLFFQYLGLDPGVFATELHPLPFLFSIETGSC